MSKVYEDRMLIESRISTGVYLESETVKQLYNGTLTELRYSHDPAAAAVIVRCKRFSYLHKNTRCTWTSRSYDEKILYHFQRIDGYIHITRMSDCKTIIVPVRGDHFNE